MLDQKLEITPTLVHNLIEKQFPEYANLAIRSVEKQGHDNCTYRLGNDMLIRIPTAKAYVLAILKEQKLLPELAEYLSINIPAPIKMGSSSIDYPFPFSIYKWISGTSLNFLTLNEKEIEQLAFDLAKFLKELQTIKDLNGPSPGQHNYWRGDHVIVYNLAAREQMIKLSNIIDSDKAIDLWENACKTQYDRAPVWIHGDLAIGNILIQNGKLSGIIDFGAMAVGDPACDLVITWTYLTKGARNIFISEMDLDKDTWLRAKAWALWKASFELCQMNDTNNTNALKQKRIIDEILYD